MKSNELKMEDSFPNWANWVATDKNGATYFYKYKPRIEGCIWYAVGGAYSSFWRQEPACVAKSWSSSLRQIVT